MEYWKLFTCIFFGGFEPRGTFTSTLKTIPQITNTSQKDSCLSQGYIIALRSKTDIKLLEAGKGFKKRMALDLQISGSVFLVISGSVFNQSSVSLSAGSVFNPACKCFQFQRIEVFGLNTPDESIFSQFSSLESALISIYFQEI